MRAKSDYILSEWLVLHAQDGKAAAMSQLLELWYPQFLRYSAGQLGDHDAAKDAVQETLLLIVRKIHRLKDPAAFPKWAYQILHRRGADFQRSEMRRRGRELAAAQAADGFVDETDPMANVDNQNAVRTALASLDGLSYSTVHLYYLHELSLRDIATICDVPVGTVKSRLHTARAKLRKLLEENS